MNDRPLHKSAGTLVTSWKKEVEAVHTWPHPYPQMNIAKNPIVVPYIPVVSMDRRPSELDKSFGRIPSPRPFQ